MQLHNQSSHSGVKRRLLYRWTCLIDVVGVRPQTTVCTRAAIAPNRTDDAEGMETVYEQARWLTTEFSVVFWSKRRLVFFPLDFGREGVEIRFWKPSFSEPVQSVSKWANCPIRYVRIECMFYTFLFALWWTGVVVPAVRSQHLHSQRVAAGWYTPTQSQQRCFAHVAVSSS